MTYSFEKKLVLKPQKEKGLSTFLIALLTAKIFAFFANKTFVFHSKSNDLKDFMKEVYRYILARGGTGLLDYFGLIFAVEVLNLSEVWSKYGLQILVIILNYVLGKKAVFISGQRQSIDNSELSE